MKIKHIVFILIIGAYGIYYFAVSEGFIKKKPHGEDGMTTTQTIIDLISPQSPKEKLDSIFEELSAARESLNNFEQWKDKVESGKIT